MIEKIVLALLALLSQVLDINRQLHQFFLFTRGDIHPGSWAAFSFANLRACSACSGATGPAVSYISESFLLISEAHHVLGVLRAQHYSWWAPACEVE